MNPQVQNLPASEQERIAREAMKLQPRLLVGFQATYTSSEWSGENTSGCAPLGDYVLIRVDECASATAGGVLYTDDIKEKMDEASVTGCIYAIGPLAFERLGHKPDVGSRVYFEKYAGLKVLARDGGLYRVMEDRCIACLMEEQ